MSSSFEPPEVQKYNPPIMQITDETQSLIEELYSGYKTQQGLTWAVILNMIG
jgi:hypothetical protein